MIDLEDRLRSAMHAAVDGAEPPDGLTAMVRRRHRRHLLRAAAAAAAAIAVLAAIPVALAVGRGAGSPPGGRAKPRPASVSESLRGQPARSSPALLLSGPVPGYYNPAPRRFEPINGLPSTRLGYRFTRIIGGWLAEPNSTTPACCSGPALPVYYLADGTRVAVRVGSGYSAAAASSAGKFWLVTYASAAQRLGTAAASVRPISVAGQPAGPAVTLPAGYLVVRAVGPYLLLTPAIKLPLPVRDELWDPASGRVVRHITGVVGANKDEVAWEPACRCAVLVLNLVTSAVFSVPLHAGTLAYGGTFSDDGRYLAAALAARGAHGGQVVRVQLAVLDIGRRTLRTLPGSTISPAASDQLVFGWQPGHNLLTASLALQGRAHRSQVAIWHPGWSALRVATVQIPVGRWVILGDRS